LSLLAPREDVRSRTDGHCRFSLREMTFVRGLNDDTGYTIWHVWSDSPRDNAANLRIFSFAALVRQVKAR
jgi:hypothetical protein